MLSHVWLFTTPWTVARQASLSFTISQSFLKLMSITSVMPFNNLILCHSLPLLLQSFPVSESFLISRHFTSGGQSIGASVLASVLSVYIQDWFPLVFDLISLQFKGLSRNFSSTTVWKHPFFGPQPSMAQLSHLYMTLGKAIALTVWTFDSVVELFFCRCRRGRRLGFDPWVRKIPWRRKPNPVFLSGESHGHRSLTG